MQKCKILTFVAVVALVSVTSGKKANISAADCNYLLENITKERDLKKRRILLRQAADICNSDPKIHYKYACELERSRKYEEALAEYVLVLKLDPKMPRAYFNMGDIYKSQERFDEAIQAYRHGLELDPDNSRAKKNLAGIMEAGHGK